MFILHISLIYLIEMDTLKSYSYNLVKHYMRPTKSYLKMTSFFNSLLKWQTKSFDLLDYYVFSNEKCYPIQIKEINNENNQVVLVNHGKEDILLKKWSLKFQLDNKTQLKKIENDLRIESNQEGTIDIEDKIEKNDKTMIVFLLDENSNEHARLEIENVPLDDSSNPRKRFSFETDEYDYKSIKNQYVNAKYKFYGIQIVDHTYNDNKITLINSGNHEVDLKGWELKQKTHSDEIKTCIDNNLLLKPQEKCEIFNANIKRKHANDSYLLETILYDEQSNEQARFELEEFKNDMSIAKRLRISNDEYFNYHQIVHQTIQIKNEY
jgi:hypothetical protein